MLAVVAAEPVDTVAAVAVPLAITMVVVVTQVDALDATVMVVNEVTAVNNAKSCGRGHSQSGYRERWY